MKPLKESFAILPRIPKELAHLKLESIFYCGNLGLLESRKITILGSRNPNPYSQSCTQILANRLSQIGAVIVSGGALGIDIIAHKASLPSTIMISPSSLDLIYPQTNAKIIKQIYEKALILSQFAPTYQPHSYSFLERNKLVVSLGECVIIPQADLQSGSMQSARYALSLGKNVFVLPHQIGQSKGTQKLAKEGKAQIIWDIDEFIESLGFQDECKLDSTNGAESETMKNNLKDEVLEFCKGNPLFEEAFLKFGEILFEYELEGKITRENGRILVFKQ